MPFLPEKKKPAKNNIPNLHRFYTAQDSFLRTSRWLSVRKIQISGNPYCEAHLQNGVLIDCAQNGHIDHIVPRSHGGAKLDPNNLMTLCASCHSYKTKLERHTHIDFTGNYGTYTPAEGEKERMLNIVAKNIR